MLGSLPIFTLVMLLAPSPVRAETIDSFSATYTIGADAQVIVTETITYDFGAEEKHGIFRDIPTTHPEPATVWYKKRYVDLALTDVTMDGSSVPYEATDDSTQLSVKIGDPNTTISGVHEYVITYTLDGALTYLSDGSAEFYWNVTGNGWEVPILGAEAIIAGDSSVQFTRKQFCYSGFVGETNSCAHSVASSSYIFRTNNLPPGAGLTIAQEIDGSSVATVVLERIPTLWLWLVGGLLWLIGLGTYVYRYKTAYRPPMTIVPMYEPLPDFAPMMTGVLMDGQLDPHDISAGLVYLASRGFLTIKKTDRKVLGLFNVDDYEVTLRKSLAEAESSFEREILALLFSEGCEVGATTALSSLKGDTGRQQANRIALQKLRDAVIKDLVANGYFEQLVSMGTLILALIIAVFLLPFLSGFLMAIFGKIFWIIVVLLITGIGALAVMYQRRTKKGYEALRHLKGFKEFLSVTEAERYAFHNAPQKSPEQFMTFLPYAIAFGVEEKWADVFKDITIPTPEWYEGSGAFSAAAFSHDLGAFSTSFASSSGTSASSGGGSSGGGGGGGGGGSW